MAIAHVRTHPAVNNKSSGTNNLSIAIDGSNASVAGNVLIVGLTVDNLTAATPNLTGIAKPAGETNSWTYHPGAGSTSTAATGVRTFWAWIKTTVAWPAGSTYAVTLSGAVVAKAALTMEFSGVDTQIGTSTGGNSTGGTPSVIIGAGSVETGCLVVGVAGFESSTDPATYSGGNGGTWSSPIAISGTSGGSSVTNAKLGMQYKILTGTFGQTYAPIGSQDSNAVILVMSAAASGGGTFESKVYRGTNQIEETKLMLGTSPVSRIYRGTNLIYGTA